MPTNRCNVTDSLPSFQASAVKSFLKNHPPPYKNGQFNNSGNVSAVISLTLVDLMRMRY